MSIHITLLWVGATGDAAGRSLSWNNGMLVMTGYGTHIKVNPRDLRCGPIATASSRTPGLYVVKTRSNASFRSWSVVVGSR